MALTAVIEVCDAFIDDWDAFIVVFKAFIAALLAMPAKKPRQRKASLEYLKVRL